MLTAAKQQGLFQLKKKRLAGLNSNVCPIRKCQNISIPSNFLFTFLSRDKLNLNSLKTQFSFFRLIINKLSLIFLQIWLI